MWRVIVLFLAFALIGCSHVYGTYDVETKKYTFAYWRLGSQELHGFRVTKTADGFEVSLDSQKADDESLQEVLRLVRHLSLGGVMP